MALAPRQTGSSIKFFILAAALQAGAQPNDVINGSTPCILPNPDEPEKPFEIKDAAAPRGSDLRHMTEASINCAYARLSQIVGLHRVVDTTYRMAQSAYLYPGQSEDERRPIEPFASYATGANEMSPLDMASGAQTIANGGLHHEPYYVDYIDAADGRRLYTHASAGTQVLDKGVALTAIDVLKGVLIRGTGRRYPLNRPGRRQDGHAAGQHQRLVRRLHARADDVGVGRRPGRLHADGERPRVRGRQPRVRPGRALPDADLAGVHEPGAGVRPAQRLGGCRRPTPARRRGCTCRATSASLKPSSRAARCSAPCHPPYRLPPGGLPPARGAAASAASCRRGRHRRRRRWRPARHHRARSSPVSCRSRARRRSRPTCSTHASRCPRRR